MLIRRGQLTLPELLRATRLPGAMVRAALLALVQHNLVDVFLLRPEPGLRAAPPAQHVYEAEAAAIAQWLRCACCSACLGDELHSYCACSKCACARRKPHILDLVAKEFAGETDTAGRPTLPFAIIHVRNTVRSCYIL